MAAGQTGAATPRPLLIHGAATLPLSAEHKVMAEANEGLIGWVIGRWHRRDLSNVYGYNDAWQDGWLGLVTAVQRFDPELGTFSVYACWYIRRSIVHGLGLVAGRNARRRPAQASAEDRRRPLSLDMPALVGDGEPAISVGDLVPDQRPTPEAAAVAAVDLERALAIARRSCKDDLDRDLLDGMLHLGPGAAALLAARHRCHPSTVVLRRNRLAGVLDRAWPR